ncbi:MAG: proline dehydrogenase family protein [Verrucomicrobiales bacterium]
MRLKRARPSWWVDEQAWTANREPAMLAQQMNSANDSNSDPAARAIGLAGKLLATALRERTAAERRENARLARMMDDPAGKQFTLALVDRLFRSMRPGVAAEAFRHLLRGFGTPKYFSLIERTLLHTGAWISHVMSELIVGAVRRKLRAETSRVIVPGETRALTAYLRRRRAAGLRINLNHLGEAILGEEEAQRRFETILQLLQRSDVDYVSVKISAIFSQINLLAWDHTIGQIKERLRPLYRAANSGCKFVNLDMEEFRDLALTLAVFRQTLDEPEFRDLSAGVALQAYLPDSWPALQELAAWARSRVAQGGAPIKVRLVKGANLAMETVEAELDGWPPAPYATKAETDANFKRMLEFACEPQNAAAVRLGVGSHNLFDLALALVLREQNEVADCIDLEMLEGMANHQARAVQAVAGDLLVYAPVVKESDFPSALAYLIRRLDENTAPGNFLRDVFALGSGTDAWERQGSGFRAAWQSRHGVSSLSRRRTALAAAAHTRTEALTAGFYNQPNTDWTDERARERVHRAVAHWRAPSPPDNLPGVDGLISLAQKAQPAWEATGSAYRAARLREAAHVMAAQRFESIAAMVHEGKKAISEADTEVSEAIDFARYYAAMGCDDIQRLGRPLGVVVIAPPWNFPYAIPASGVLAALMAANAVILKPAPETRAIASHLANQLWQAGIPRDVLEFFPCEDDDVGRSLLIDSRVNAVVLTGAYQTARAFLDWRPSMRLLAETSGKNAIVLTALADRDLAVKDLVRSAFGHAGQKCSAGSLAILETEVYEDPAFRRQLRDAAASLPVGPATDPASVVTPLIRPPSDALRRALTTLDDGESWLLEPRRVSADPCLWSPGIRLGVRRGGWFQQTECFGPVLGLMHARDLDEAIEIQNDVPFGLTAGLHSLDERQIARWRDKVGAGNLYINRPITGAIVQRQPFGGWKKSSVGAGAKAGGPNYVLSLCHFAEEPGTPTGEAAESYARAWNQDFSVEHDPAGLRAESNIFRYRPCRGVVLRLEENQETILPLAQLASETCDAPLHISLAGSETQSQLAERLPELATRAEYFRTISPPSDLLLRAAYAAGLNWINAPISHEGRVELRYWLREQAISETRHRYGNVMPSARPGPIV